MPTFSVPTRIAALLAASLLLTVGHVQTAHAVAFIVNSQTDAVDATPGDGVCATVSLPGEGVRCTLRAAIQEANAQAGADTIQLPAGVYSLTIPGAEEGAGLTGDLDVLGDLTLTGAGAANTVIDANQIDRVFDVATGVATEIRGVTVQKGRSLEGGGIRSKGHQLSLIDSVVANNVATGDGPLAVNWGGGILALGNLELTRSAVRSNTALGTANIAGQGGGIRGLTVTLVDSSVVDNVAGSASPGGRGAGIEASRVTLTRSTVRGNRSIGTHSNFSFR